MHIGCTYGNIKQAIVVNADGRFDVPGVQNITAHPVDLGVLHPARFTGRIRGGVMTLTIALTDTSVTLGPVSHLWPGAAHGAVSDLPLGDGRAVAPLTLPCFSLRKYDPACHPERRRREGPTKSRSFATRANARFAQSLP